MRLDGRDVASGNVSARELASIIIRGSKTDQEGHGATIAVARGVTACPVKAVKAWLQAAGISEGPLFRPVTSGRLGAPSGSPIRACAAS